MTGPVVVKCLGLVGRVEAVKCDGRTPAGEYLRDYEPEKHGGRGEATFTRDLERAKVFPDVAAAWRFIGQQPRSRPTRPDGKPNRPLMAFTLQILGRDAAEPARMSPPLRMPCGCPLDSGCSGIHPSDT